MQSGLQIIRKHGLAFAENNNNNNNNYDDDDDGNIDEEAIAITDNENTTSSDDSLTPAYPAPRPYPRYVPPKTSSSASTTTSTSSLMSGSYARLYAGKMAAAELAAMKPIPNENDSYDNNNVSIQSFQSKPKQKQKTTKKNAKQEIEEEEYEVESADMTLQHLRELVAEMQSAVTTCAQHTEALPSLAQHHQNYPPPVVSKVPVRKQKSTKKKDEILQIVEVEPEIQPSQPQVLQLKDEKHYKVDRMNFASRYKAALKQKKENNISNNNKADISFASTATIESIDREKAKKLLHLTLLRRYWGPQKQHQQPHRTPSGILRRSFNAWKRVSILVLISSAWRWKRLLSISFGTFRGAVATMAMKRALDVALQCPPGWCVCECLVNAAIVPASEPVSQLWWGSAYGGDGVVEGFNPKREKLRRIAGACAHRWARLGLNLFLAWVDVTNDLKEIRLWTEARRNKFLCRHCLQCWRATAVKLQASRSLCDSSVSSYHSQLFTKSFAAWRANQIGISLVRQRGKRIGHVYGKVVNFHLRKSAFKAWKRVVSRRHVMFRVEVKVAFSRGRCWIAAWRMVAVRNRMAVIKRYDCLMHLLVKPQFQAWKTRAVTNFAAYRWCEEKTVQKMEMLLSKSFKSWSGYYLARIRALDRLQMRAFKEWSRYVMVWGYHRKIVCKKCLTGWAVTVLIEKKSRLSQLDRTVRGWKARVECVKGNKAAMKWRRICLIQPYFKAWKAMVLLSDQLRQHILDTAGAKKLNSNRFRKIFHAWYRCIQIEVEQWKGLARQHHRKLQLELFRNWMFFSLSKKNQRIVKKHNPVLDNKDEFVISKKNNNKIPTPAATAATINEAAAALTLAKQRVLAARGMLNSSSITSSRSIILKDINKK